MRKLVLVPMYAKSVFRSPLHGGKKQNIVGSKTEERNQGEKTQSETRGKQEFYLTPFFFMITRY